MHVESVGRPVAPVHRVVDQHRDGRHRLAVLRLDDVDLTAVDRGGELVAGKRQRPLAEAEVVDPHRCLVEQIRDDVISRADSITANGRWMVTVTGTNTFTLNGSRKDDLHIGDGFSAGWVRSSVLPDCTGTQTSIQPVTVTSSPGCVPWSAYPSKEVLTIF